MEGSGSNSSSNGRDAERRLAESDRIVAAARTATAEAVRQHKLLGEPIVVSCDGKVVILRPEEIPDSVEDIELKARVKGHIIESLRELSDRTEQERLWLSTGGEVSSFVEACCGLFDDSGLADELERGPTRLGAAADEALRQLDAQLNLVDDSVPPEQVIASQAMARVRELAAVALRLVEPGP